MVLGSFSKSLAVTGHRVGYLCGAVATLRQALKVQDAAVICAPRMGQIAVLAALAWPDLDRWMADRRGEISARVRAFVQAIDARSGPFSVEHAGAFFAWLRHAETQTSHLLPRLRAAGLADQERVRGSEVADLLAREARVLCLPGEMAGALGQNRIRVAVGNAPESRLREAAARLQRLDLPSSG